MLAHILPYWGNFARLNLVAGVILGLLSLTLIFLPGLIHWLFALEGTAATDVISRRAGMLFAGISVIALMSRHAMPNGERRPLATGMTLLMTGLIVLGLSDFARGLVGIGIFVAIVVEVFFASAYARYALGRPDLT